MKDGKGSLESSLGNWLANLGSTEAALHVLEISEALHENDPLAETPVEIWSRFLNETRRPSFLQALPDSASRYRWADSALSTLLATQFGLEELLEQRAREHPDRTLFQEAAGADFRTWSYENILRRLRTMGALFWSTHSAPPRVAIVSENTLDGACCDLACLAYDILVTPLNPHFNGETLAWIFNELGINTVVVETEEFRDKLDAVRHLVDQPFHLFVLDPEANTPGPHESRLGEAMAQIGKAQADEVLENRPRRDITDLATVMFTSGSTGKPKGVQYTIYNLISKRFARAAALPKVGEGELLLSFLPLYHTFGRYLEMMGMIFWGGTYVFAGNPSLETLLAGLQEFRPTGLISIPRRWQQIRERCLEEMDAGEDRSGREEAFRRVVGGRLRWGLSAAGALEPAAFHFFQRHGVELCSGFGMTEATGGITMTPPGEYEDMSVGTPLPGLTARLSEEGELQISGHYVARYLGDPAPHPSEEYWLPTGDIFRVRDSGHYEIVDRIKDIYKNSKGQTVAPGAIEQKLAPVPGIARSFLVGDGREYNVLLIVPDLDDPVLKERRLNRLTNPALSVGLPPFLTKGAGMFSGMMLSQYTADMLIVEQKTLSAPAFIQSIPAAAEQEDFVSMGMNSSLKTRQILENAFGVLGIEFMAAAQALDFRDFTPGRGTRAAHAEVRKHVEYLDVDRPLHRDHNIMQEVVRKLTVLEAVESEVGQLSTY